MPRDTRNDALAGLGALGLAATAFSWGFVIVKVLGLPAATLASYRLGIGAVAVGAVALALRVPRATSLRAPLLAGVLFGAHQLVYILATQSTSIAIVTLVGALQPLLVAMVSHRVVGERAPPAVKWFAALAAAGVGIVVWANLDDPSRSLGGDLLSLVNLGVFTGFFLASKRARLDGTHTLTLTAITLVTALAVVAPVMLLTSPPSARAPGAAWQWGLLAVLALVPGNGHLLVNWAHRRVTAALASLFLVSVPILASVWAHLVLGEPYGWRHGVGMIAVAVAVEGGRRAERRARLREASSRGEP